MYFSPVLVLAALPFLVAAAPSERAREGISISIEKRSGIRNADLVVDIARHQACIQHTLAKIERGFEAYQSNMGSPHPSASRPKRSAKRANGIPLTDNSAQFWYGSITVGTPAATFTVDFDTGSSDFFLPSSRCSLNCEGHTLYNPSSSSTSNDKDQTFNLRYEDNSTVSGEWYTDTVALAGYQATDQSLGAAITYSSGLEYNTFPADGLLGMGHASLLSFGDSTVFQTLVSQGQVSDPVFSFYLAESGSELYIGGTNQNHYRGSFTYVPVSVLGFWQVFFDGISVNGKAVIGIKEAIIDTGSSHIIGDPQSVQDIYAQIPGSKESEIVVGSNRLWTFPCNSNATVSISFSETDIQIRASTFNLGLESPGSSDCVGGIVPQDKLDLWVIGDVFLQNVYTSFDIVENLVGFASLA
ncbi:eukaryotic aspartyl protease [Lactarius tabidus]